MYAEPPDAMGIIKLTQWEHTWRGSTSQTTSEGPVSVYSVELRVLGAKIPLWIYGPGRATPAQKAQLPDCGGFLPCSGVLLWTRHRQYQNLTKWTSNTQTPITEYLNWNSFLTGLLFNLSSHWRTQHYYQINTLRTLISCHFPAFHNYSWDSQGKNTEVFCHSILQWTTFCQNSPPWPICLGWPYTAWLIVSLSFKIAKCQRIDAFELWCWGRLVRVP